MVLAFVDDHEDTLDASVALGRLVGHDAYGFADAMSALSELVAIQPDIIFSDLTMPCMNGLDFALEVRKQPQLSQTYLVALTSHSSRAYRDAAARAGFDAFHVKPLTTVMVSDAIAAALARRYRP